MISYLVDWGDEFVGGFTKDFEQLYNGRKERMLDDLLFYGIDNHLKIITPQELDELRGEHKPTLQEILD